MGTEKHQCEEVVREYGIPRLCKTTATIHTEDDRWYCKRHYKIISDFWLKHNKGVNDNEV